MLTHTPAPLWMSSHGNLANMAARSPVGTGDTLSALRTMDGDSSGRLGRSAAQTRGGGGGGSQLRVVPSLASQASVMSAVHSLSGSVDTSDVHVGVGPASPGRGLVAASPTARSMRGAFAMEGGAGFMIRRARSGRGLDGVCVWVCAFVLHHTVCFHSHTPSLSLTHTQVWRPSH